MSTNNANTSSINVRMVILVMLLALIVAIAGSLAFSARSAANDTTAEAELRNIDGVSLRLSGDPAQGVLLLQQPGANQQTVQVITQPVQQPSQTETEQQPAPTATQQPVPTATATPGQIVVAVNTPVPQAQVAGVNPIIFIDYAIQPNDTLYKIATARMDSSIALISRFGLSSDDIVQGSVIKLPIGNPAYCPGRRPYAVGEGDTAYSIAQRYNTTHQNLQAINRLDANFTIRIGEILCVP